MLTEDFYPPLDGTWLVVPLISAQTTVSNVGGTRLAIRFGALSSSEGFLLHENETMVVDETLYIKAFDTTKRRAKVVVTR